MATTAFDCIGRIGQTGKRHFKGRLDQIHVFNKVIDAAMVKRLHNNFAPRASDVAFRAVTGKATDSGSVLFEAFDLERDQLRVSSFTKPKNGKLIYNNDGTFKYQSNPDFIGADSFDVVIEDQAGGFSHVAVDIDVMTPSRSSGIVPRASRDVDAIKVDGKEMTIKGMRCPRALDWDADGDQDLLVGNAGKVWLYQNTAKKSAKPVYAAGVRVQAGGKDISLTGLALIDLEDMTGDGLDDLIVADESKKLRVYRNTSAKGKPVAYAAAITVRSSAGGDFVMPDSRFDLGDLNQDGLPDLVVGARIGEVRAYLNTGKADAPQFDPAASTVLLSGAKNLYPHIVDLDGKGTIDFALMTHKSAPKVYLNPKFSEALPKRGVNSFALIGMDGDPIDKNLRQMTDGMIADFADLNGDAYMDIVFGGHTAKEGKLYIGFGRERTAAMVIQEIENIYDAGIKSGNLGDALQANEDQQLNHLKSLHRELINIVDQVKPDVSKQIFQEIKAHAEKYPAFLSMANVPIDTTKYRYMPSVATQTFLTMHHVLPDTPKTRQTVAETFGLRDWQKKAFLDFGVLMADFHPVQEHTRQSYYELLSRTSPEVFPDTLITLGRYGPDGIGGLVSSFTGSKNVFGNNVGSHRTAMKDDMPEIMESYSPGERYNGDFPMTVFGHEVTHSIDGYLRDAVNQDLNRRRHQWFSHSAGPDIRSDESGKFSQSATQENFKAKGYWDGKEDWKVAWERYWMEGPGSKFRKEATFKKSPDFFLSTPQEGTAGTSNFHYDYGEGHMFVAVERYRKAEAGDASIAPLKAMINGLVHFIDFRSAGMNKYYLPDLKGMGSHKPTDFSGSSFAYLVRNDDGYITQITVGENIYQFAYDERGVAVELLLGPTKTVHAADDVAVTLENQVVTTNVRRNDTGPLPLGGGSSIKITSISQGKHGKVSDNKDGTISYKPNPNFRGKDSYTYTVVGAKGNSKTATVQVTVK